MQKTHNFSTGLHPRELLVQKNTLFDTSPHSPQEMVPKDALFDTEPSAHLRSTKNSDEKLQGEFFHCTKDHRVITVDELYEIIETVYRAQDESLEIFADLGA